MVQYHPYKADKARALVVVVIVQWEHFSICPLHNICSTSGACGDAEASTQA
jgi:hypothetical protein